MTWQDVWVHTDASGPPAAARNRAVSRRGFLRGVLGVGGIVVVGGGSVGTVAGCDALGGGGNKPGPDHPSPLLGFLASTAALADRYDAAIVAVPTLVTNLTPIRDAHRAHVMALATAITAPTPRPATPGSNSSTDAPGAVAALAAAEKAARDEAITTCLGAPARLAPLVGSIAAARATHLEVLS